MSILNEPVSLGGFALPNRIVMAPLTRCRADENRVPTDLMRQYYEQRASAGLIISEATCISPMGVGYPQTPGIWNQAQIAGWRHITDAVHDVGGRMVIQLWHVGRVSDPALLDGNLPVAPSAVKLEGHVRLLRPLREHVTPKALEVYEIAAIVEQYRAAAINAREAGFDGVEIHAANGYLIDQFLQNCTNHREDEYGGSIPNRLRFLEQVFDAVNQAWSADRIGVHLSPRGDMHHMGDSQPEALFTQVAALMREKGAAFLFLREYVGDDSLLPAIRCEFGGAVIGNEKLSREQAELLIESGQVEAVAFGRDYIANPDLAERLACAAPLNTPDDDTFYLTGEKGYIDYPALF